MDPIPDVAAASSLRLLRDLQDASGEAGAALARRLGMSATDASAIEHIALSDRPLGPAELGSRLAVTRSSATEVIDRLVRAGHVERVRDETDRRRFRLEPTAAAQDRVRTEIAPLVRALEAAGDGLSPSERDVVARYLQRVAAAYRGFAASAEDAQDAAPPG